MEDIAPVKNQGANDQLQMQYLLKAHETGGSKYFSKKCSIISHATHFQTVKRSGHMKTTFIFRYDGHN